MVVQYSVQHHDTALSPRTFCNMGLRSNGAGTLQYLVVHSIIIDPVFPNGWFCTVPSTNLCKVHATSHCHCQNKGVTIRHLGHHPLHLFTGVLALQMSSTAGMHVGCTSYLLHMHPCYGAHLRGVSLSCSRLDCTITFSIMDGQQSGQGPS